MRGPHGLDPSRQIEVHIKQGKTEIHLPVAWLHAFTSGGTTEVIEIAVRNREGKQ